MVPLIARFKQAEFAFPFHWKYFFIIRNPGSCVFSKEPSQ